jgi:DUF2075 family protein
MIVYSATKQQFTFDVLNNQIEKQILLSFVREKGYKTSKSEIESWKNSMMYMNNVISDSAIPDDVGIAIEYQIPRTSSRIDFILTGLNEDNRKIAVLVELKQWSTAELTDLDGIVKTFVGGGVREVTHPSQQVWSYATLIEDFNENIQTQDISLKPCAYLHNYEEDTVIRNPFYQNYIDKAPIFLRSDAMKLQNFIKKFVKYGDKGDILYAIEHGKIAPSKALADSLSSMLSGNQEFTLIDDQKVVYETALKLAQESTPQNKNILIVEGGPGTGKSVVAIHLLTELTQKKYLAQYVTRNSAPRQVYQAKLSGTLTRTRIANLFKSSGSFYDLDPNTFDTLIIDEAHRLNEKSGLYYNLGDNQIKEIIQASKFSIFFIDEDQRVTLKDIGKKSEIIQWAETLGVNVRTLELPSQFRCNGSDGYLAWIDNVLAIRETANQTLEDINYDIQVINDPQTLHNIIAEKNLKNNKARMLAGYCWKWVSKKDSQIKDIVIGDYSATWNLNSHGQSWIIHPDSVKEIGCIHTSQGLELDYVGVIIGPDLIIRNGEIVTDVSQRASTDKSVFGHKKLYKENPIEAKNITDMIIKNTYRTLMTRGMKGCYIYCTDPETQEYFKELLQKKSKLVQYGSQDTASLNIDKN